MDSFTVSKRAVQVIAGIAVVVLAIVVIASAGEDNEASPEVPTTTPTVDEAESRFPGCEEVGITPEQRKEGTCTDEGDGRNYTVVEQGSTLVLPDLKARLRGIEYEDTLSGSGTAKADGQFVVFEIEVTNDSLKPQAFDSRQDQVRLSAASTEFSQDFDAMNGPEERSFVSQKKEIEPGGTATGTVVFDVPDQYVDDVGRNGTLVILPFQAVNSPAPPEVIGVIRTYE